MWGSEGGLRGPGRAGRRGLGEDGGRRGTQQVLSIQRGIQSSSCWSLSRNGCGLSIPQEPSPVRGVSITHILNGLQPLPTASGSKLWQGLSSLSTSVRPSVLLLTVEGFACPSPIPLEAPSCRGSRFPFVSLQPIPKVRMPWSLRASRERRSG